MLFFIALYLLTNLCFALIFFYFNNSRKLACSSLLDQGKIDISNWEQNMLHNKSYQPFCRKRISVLTGLKVLSLKCKCLFYSLRPATLLKKRLWHRCFLLNFAKFLRTSFLTEHVWWLLLSGYS